MQLQMNTFRLQERRCWLNVGKNALATCVTIQTTVISQSFFRFGAVKVKSQCSILDGCPLKTQTCSLGVFLSSSLTPDAQFLVMVARSALAQNTDAPAHSLRCPDFATMTHALVASWFDYCKVALCWAAFEDGLEMSPGSKFGCQATDWCQV